MKKLFCLCLMLLCSASVMAQRGRQTPPGFVLLNGPYPVAARNYSVYEFIIDARYGTATVEGQISVRGGGSQDIEACIFNYEGFEAFINRQSASAYLCTGRVQLKRFVIALDPGRYFLVFNNRYSMVMDKLVDSYVTITHLPPPSVQPQPPPERLQLSIKDVTVPVYPEAFYEQGKMVRIKGLLPEKDQTCSDYGHTGMIVEVEYKRDVIIAFTIKLADGRRRYIEYDFNRINKIDKDNLHTLIKENNKVVVTGVTCGNGGILDLDEIRLTKNDRIRHRR